MIKTRILKKGDEVFYTDSLDKIVYATVLKLNGKLHVDLLLENTNIKVTVRIDEVGMVKDFDYPEVTKGSILAREIREEANKLSTEERQKYFEMGMEIINGSKKKKISKKPLTKKK